MKDEFFERLTQRHLRQAGGERKNVPRGDYLRICGSKLSSNRQVSNLDGTEIKTLDLTWDYDE